MMLERFLPQTSFSSYEDFSRNFRVNVPARFNFAWDVVDDVAAQGAGAHGAGLVQREGRRGHLHLRPDGGALHEGRRASSSPWASAGETR